MAVSCVAFGLAPADANLAQHKSCLSSLAPAGATLKLQATVRSALTRISLQDYLSVI